MTASDRSLEPREVPPVSTAHRKICTEIPVPASAPILNELWALEPVSMQGQPPIVWDKASGFSVHDKWGNKWIDFSSGVLVTNAGHGHHDMVSAIVGQANHGLLHNYCFPSEVRKDCCKKILEFSSPHAEKVFLLTTGSESTECALKLCRTWGTGIGGKEKNIMVSFENAFHGRTFGAQLMGGIPSLKEWIHGRNDGFVQVPFPDGFYNEDLSFESFTALLASAGIDERKVCGVITETYQGGGAEFLPDEYVKELRKWCDEQDALLVFDEVQAGFGRTGKKFGFEHYGVRPDLFCCGKGISSGLPVSAVLGRAEVLDQYPPGSMTSTHTGNPIGCAAVIASIDIIERERLVENTATVGKKMHERLTAMARKHEVIGQSRGRGFVAGLHVVVPGTKEPDKELAGRICTRIIEKGVMMFSPVGKATLKIAPPLCLPVDAMEEACDVIDEAITEVTA